MKATKLIATVAAVSLMFAGTAKVSMNNVSLSSEKGNVELVVESNQAVKGLQFDLRYHNERKGIIIKDFFVQIYQRYLLE